MIEELREDGIEPSLPAAKKIIEAWLGQRGPDAKVCQCCNRPLRRFEELNSSIAGHTLCERTRILEIRQEKENRNEQT
jgi:hypothetical protein